jgi:hypothetical protein
MHNFLGSVILLVMLINRIGDFDQPCAVFGLFKNLQSKVELDALLWRIPYLPSGKANDRETEFKSRFSYCIKWTATDGRSCHGDLPLLVSHVPGWFGVIDINNPKSGFSQKWVP